MSAYTNDSNVTQYEVWVNGNLYEGGLTDPDSAVGLGEALAVRVKNGRRLYSVVSVMRIKRGVPKGYAEWVDGVRK